MTIKFTKMHGLGNDFVVIDTLSQPFFPHVDTVKQMADRKYGIGCDQLLLLELSKDDGVDFLYRIFNSDGMEVENCGNGARCMGLYIKHHKLLDKKVVVLRTQQRDLQIHYRDSDRIVVDMGVPIFSQQCGVSRSSKALPIFTVDYEGSLIRYSLVNVGNPHAVIFLEKDQQVDMEVLGQWMNQSNDFCEGINASAVRVLDENKIELQVYERGAGMTRACGSAACAAVAVGVQRHLLSTSVDVYQAGGVLNIEWHQGDTSIMMMGGADFVFQGVWCASPCCAN